MYIVSYVIFLVLYIAIACCEGVRRQYPLNVIALSVFTLALSFLAASIALFHSVLWVMMAMGITAAVCLGITLFSFQTKIDFTGTKSQYCRVAIIYSDQHTTLPFWSHIVFSKTFKNHATCKQLTFWFYPVSGIGAYLCTASWVLFIFAFLIIIFWARDLPVLYTGM